MKIIKFSAVIAVLVGFTLQSQASEPPICYEYYEGEFEWLPDFDQLPVVAEGEVYDFGLGVAQREDAFAIRFKTCLVIEAAGNYEFCLNSDDGSKLLVDGQVVVDSDGTHGPGIECGWINLEPGVYFIEVQYFEYYGDQELAVTFGLDGTDLIPLEAAYIKSPKEGDPEPDPEPEKECRGDLSIGPSGRKQKGKGIVNSSGSRQRYTDHLVWGKNRFKSVLRNRGTHAETFRLKGSKRKSFYRLKYRVGSKNITSAVVRGTYEIELAKNAQRTFKIEVKPNSRYRYGKKVKVSLIARGTSAVCKDKVKLQLKKMKKKKH